MESLDRLKEMKAILSDRFNTETDPDELHNIIRDLERVTDAICKMLDENIV